MPCPPTASNRAPARTCSTLVDLSFGIAAAGAESPRRSVPCRLSSSSPAACRPKCSSAHARVKLPVDAVLRHTHVIVENVAHPRQRAHHRPRRGQPDAAAATVHSRCRTARTIRRIDHAGIDHASSAALKTRARLRNRSALVTLPPTQRARVAHRHAQPPSCSQAYGFASVSSTLSPSHTTMRRSSASRSAVDQNGKSQSCWRCRLCCQRYRPRRRFGERQLRSPESANCRIRSPDCPPRWRTPAHRALPPPRADGICPICTGSNVAPLPMLANPRSPSLAAQHGCVTHRIQVVDRHHAVTDEHIVCKCARACR